MKIEDWELIKGLVFYEGYDIFDLRNKKGSYLQRTVGGRSKIIYSPSFIYFSDIISSSQTHGRLSSYTTRGEFT